MSEPISAPPAERPADTPWRIVVGAAVGTALVVMLIVLAFTWPTKTAQAQNTPVAVSGSAQAVAALESALAEAQPGVFDLHRVADRAAAVHRIETREVYGAIVLDDPAAPEVLTAPAGSAQATQLLTGVAQQLQAQQAAAGGRVEVTAVVPLSADDPNGAGMASLAFPLVIGGMIGGVVIAFAVVTPIRRVVSVLVLGVVGGLGLTLITETWFGYVDGGFVRTWLAIGLAIAATAAFVAGCAAVLGRPGIGLGALVTILFANPLSGATMPWEWIAEPWGLVGQYLVPGAATSLVRSLTYFPAASTAQQWLVLVAWCVLGVLLLLVGHRRHRSAGGQ